MSAARPRIEPLCLAISVKEFHAKLKARRGEWVEYASGPALDHHHEAVRLARDYADRGVVTLTQQRQPDRSWKFLAKAIAAAPEETRAQAGPCHAAPPRAPRAPRAAPGPDSDAGRVLALLAGCADDGRPCPTNVDIARALRLKDSEAARYIVGLLAEGGHIRIRNRGPRVTRIVTIMASGASTSARLIAVGKGFRG
jgi:hypothetical protein